MYSSLFEIFTPKKTQCTKKICPYTYYGTKKPPEIEEVIESCEDAKVVYKQLWQVNVREIYRYLHSNKSPSRIS